MNIAVIILYCVLLTFILLFSISQFSLAIVYLKRKKEELSVSEITEFPNVTIQLPVYNERYVIERLIHQVCELDYPKEKLEIQILDDSNDVTSELIQNLVLAYQLKGFDIQQLTREVNEEYKAGALKEGMKTSKGEFLAIFDADFLPEKDFLKRTVPHFSNEKVGVVQTRWGHLNEDYSLLTKLQSFALNAHFSVEQLGRSSKKHFINFNGTAGIWRRSTIEDAGGWQGDTITEDLDLSYRAQLNGWEIKYLENLISPAELPPEINALKSQQYRWAKGAAECARKNLSAVLEKPELSFATKWHAFFHLTNSVTWFCLLVSGVLLVPFLFIINNYYPESSWWALFSIYHLSFICLFLFYWIGNKKFSFKGPKDYFSFLIYYPAFLSVSMGISFYMAIGVVKGYLGKQSPFVRTPKFNVANNKGSFKNKEYVKFKFSWVSLIEIVLCVYFIYGTTVALRFESYLALPFLIMQAVGFGLVLFFSVLHKIKAA